MTALKNLADKINSMKESLSKITVELPNVYDAEVHNIFNKLRNQLGLLETQLMPELLKLDTKKNSKDPVSGAPRYGPKQMEKIELVTKEAISLRIQYEELITIYQSYCTTYLPQKQNLTPKDTLPADLTSVPVFHSQEDKSVITTLSWNSEIHQKAEESRQKRTEEAEVEEARRLQLLEDLKIEIKKCNDRPRGLIQIPMILQEIRVSVQDVVVVKTLLRTITELLGSIIKSPDKDSLRRLRPDHPLLWDRITKHPGGLSLLLAVGFDLRLETDTETDGVGTSTNTENAARQTSDQHSCSEASALLHSTRQIGSSRLTMMMEEPDVGRPDVWVVWFDGLQGSKAFLDQELQS